VETVCDFTYCETSLLNYGCQGPLLSPGMYATLDQVEECSSLESSRSYCPSHGGQYAI